MALRLKHRKVSSEAIHKAYEVAFREYYSACDAFDALQKEYGNIPCYVLRPEDKLLIDAAGGRRSKAYQKMKACEAAAIKIDRMTTRVRTRGTQLAKQKSVSSLRRAVSVYATALQ